MLVYMLIDFRRLSSRKSTPPVQGPVTEITRVDSIRCRKISKEYLNHKRTGVH